MSEPGKKRKSKTRGEVLGMKKKGGKPGDTLTPKKEEIKAKFIEEYRKAGTVWFAAKEAGTCRQTIWEWRNEDPNFDAACMKAFDDNTEILEQTAFVRAREGTSKGSDMLLMFLIKKRKPEYRDNVNVNLGGQKGGEPVSISGGDPLSGLAADIIEKIATGEYVVVSKQKVEAKGE